MEEFGGFKVNKNPIDGNWYQLINPHTDLCIGDVIVSTNQINANFPAQVGEIHLIKTSHIPEDNFGYYTFSYYKLGENISEVLKVRKDNMPKNVERLIFNRLVNGLQFSNFRGFKQSPFIELSDFGRITFLVGPNNSGKSLIGRHFESSQIDFGKSTTKQYKDEDFHNFQIDLPIKFKTQFNIEFFRRRSEVIHFKYLEELTLVHEIQKHNSGYISLVYLESNRVKSHLDKEPKITVPTTFQTNPSFLTLKNPNATLNIDSLTQFTYNLFKNTHLILAPIRSFDKSNDNPIQKTGQELGYWITNPDNRAAVVNAKRQVRALFKRLGINPPDDFTFEEKSNKFQFIYDAAPFSSDRLGTGMTMLTILLFELFRKKELSIVFIDEIESHLQPGLIRELIKILRNFEADGKKLDIQWIIATHSPTVLDCAQEGDIIYRFEKVGDECRFHQFFRGREDVAAMRQAANDLGVLPGDALLSNVVIWVEGPTDILWVRAFLREYIKVYNKTHRTQHTLIEGLHYSILTTGGGLIKHFDFSEGYDPDEGMQVLRINPNPFVIIDSDGVDAEHEKFQRALRIAEALRVQNSTQTEKVKAFLENEEIKNDNPSPADTVHNFWWLRGKEIENYCPPRILEDFYTGLKEGKTKVEWDSEITDWNAFSETEGLGDLLDWRGIKGAKAKSGTIKHKGQLASYVYEHLDAKDFDAAPDDLKHALERLVEYIVKVNVLGE